MGRKKVLVLGYSGQLASEFRNISRSNNEYQFASKESLGFADPSVIVSRLEESKADFVVNCLAYTAVDRAETEREECFRLNEEIPAVLAKASNRVGFHLLHFSTDYVFDGTLLRAYREEDVANPLNAYGESKLRGEQAVLDISYSATVLRTSWIYSQFGSNFLKTMLQLAENNTSLKIVDDQVGSPTWTRDLVSVVDEYFLEQTGRSDLFHFSGEGQTSWAGFATEIFGLMRKSVSVERITSSEYVTAAERPRYSVLSNEKLLKKFPDLSVPRWQSSLTNCLDSINFGKDVSSKL